MRMRLRLSLRSALVLVALCAGLARLGTWIWSPTSRLAAQLRAGEPEYVRRDAAGSLGRQIPFWEVDRAVSILIQTLDDPSPRVRESATVGLAELGTKAHRAIPSLIRHLADKDRRMRSAAAATLGFVAEPGDSSDAEVVPSLVLALGDADLDVRLFAVGALIKLGDVRAVAPTLVAAKAESGVSDNSDYPERLLRGVKANRGLLGLGFLACLRDERTEYREAAFQLLVKNSGSMTAESALRQTLRDENPTVRRWAASKLEALGVLEAPSNPAPP